METRDYSLKVCFQNDKWSRDCRKGPGSRRRCARTRASPRSPTSRETGARDGAACLRREKARLETVSNSEPRRAVSLSIRVKFFFSFFSFFVGLGAPRAPASHAGGSPAPSEKLKKITLILKK